MPEDAFMERARALALANVTRGTGGPFGAVIVLRGEVIAEGVNAVTATNDPTAHAEVSAIRRACQTRATFRLAGCEIYASCEPCPMCLAAIHWARIDRIYYDATAEEAAAAGFDDAALYREIARPASRRRLPMQRLAGEGEHRPFAAWARAATRIPY
ncbi:MAG: nucleoside deaminase [Candidatus Dormibacteria bacterium]